MLSGEKSCLNGLLMPCTTLGKYEQLEDNAIHQRMLGLNDNSHGYLYCSDRRHEFETCHFLYGRFHSPCQATKAADVRHNALERLKHACHAVLASSWSLNILTTWRQDC
jgi:hypothetical protein